MKQRLPLQAHAILFALALPLTTVACPIGMQYDGNGCSPPYQYSMDDWIREKNEYLDSLGPKNRAPVVPMSREEVAEMHRLQAEKDQRDAAMALFNQDVDVIAFHTGSTAVMAAAQERGKMAVAYHSDMRKTGPDAQIVAVTHQWGSYYTERVRAVQNGTWKSANLWGGVREGMIRVGDFGPKVPAAVQQEVLNAQKAIGAGKLQPFRAGKAPVRDNDGQERIAAGQALTDAQILQMNWLVEGVVGKVAR